jgi:hypothetical protein
MHALLLSAALCGFAAGDMLIDQLDADFQMLLLREAHLN